MLTGPAVAAALLAGAACWLWLRPSLTSLDLGPWVLLATGVVACGLVVLAAGALMPLLLGGAAVVAALRLRVRARRRLATAETGARIQLACDGLASSLAAGVPVAAALEVAARDWPPLAIVTGSLRLGAPVPASLRELAEREQGASDLVLVAAAWQVAERGGASLATAVASVAALLRRRESTRRLVRSELASARATARLLAGLPVLTLVLGSGLGGDPVRFMVATVPGLACLAGGLLLAFAGLWWIEAIAGFVEVES